MLRKIVYLLLVLMAAAFIALVAVHAAAIGGILAYSALKAKSIAAQHAETPPAAIESAATYTVVSGDTPLAIAKKLHVNCDDLLKANNITDARKLQIGQKLRIPVAKNSISATETSSLRPSSFVLRHSLPNVS